MCIIHCCLLSPSPLQWTKDMVEHQLPLPRGPDAPFEVA